MKFVVTCLEDNGKRVLASQSKVFSSIPDAIKYCNTVAEIRRPSIVPVATDAQHAAEFIYDHIVEKHPALLEYCDHEGIKKELRFELGGDDIMVVFAPGNDIGTAFHKDDMTVFNNELERLIIGD